MRKLVVWSVVMSGLKIMIIRLFRISVMNHMVKQHLHLMELASELVGYG